MNFYEAGRDHGICQYGMDTLTEQKRSNESLGWLAITSAASAFENKLDNISLSYYVSGFTYGYISQRYESEVRP